MRVFSHPVKYVDEDGTIRDISLDIKAKSGGGFVSAAHEIITTFQRKLTEGISLEYQDLEIMLVPAVGQGATPVAQLSSDGKTVTYEVNNVTSFVYELTYTGFKEDIVVEEYTGQTEYTFTLFTNGLTLCEEYGSWYLADAQGNVEAIIGDIIVFTADERNNTMGSITCETVRANQEYTLTIHLDADYLADEDTVYPIRIDPTIEINYDQDGAGAIEDVTINENSTYSGTSGALYVGRSSSGYLYRALMRFSNLSMDGIAADQITSATVELRDLMCQGDEDITIDCHIYNTGSPSWSESGTTTWSSVGTAYIGTLLDSHVISYGKGNVESHRYAFNILAAAKAWANGTQSPAKGLVFKANGTFESQTGDAVKTWHKTFASYNRSAYRPSLSISYDSSVAVSNSTGIADNTEYYIMNYDSERYISLEYLSDTDSTNIFARPRSAAFVSRWKTEEQTNGTFQLISVYSSTGKVMHKSGTNIVLNTDTGSSNQKFTISRINSGTYMGLYYIRNGNYYVAQDDDYNVYLTTTASSSAVWSFMAVNQRDAELFYHDYTYTENGATKHFDTSTNKSYFKTVLNGIGYTSYSSENVTPTTAYSSLRFYDDVFVFAGHGEAGVISFNTDGIPLPVQSQLTVMLLLGMSLVVIGNI